MHTEASKDHQWLRQLLGDWRYETDSAAEPGTPPDRHQGTERVRELGPLWVLCEGQGDMPGGGIAQTLMTLGSAGEGKFVGSWIGSMMTHLWRYEGTLDAARKVLTLSAEGPDFDHPGRTRRYRDVIEILAPDHRTLSAFMQCDDGTWRQFMIAHYWRV
ncbi:MAG: DUF1579 domain-containing protein [Rhodocyclaceae bacterium]